MKQINDTCNEESEERMITHEFDVEIDESIDSASPFLYGYILPLQTHSPSAATPSLAHPLPLLSLAC